MGNSTEQASKPKTKQVKSLHQTSHLKCRGGGLRLVLMCLTVLVVACNIDSLNAPCYRIRLGRGSTIKLFVFVGYSNRAIAKNKCC